MIEGHTYITRPDLSSLSIFLLCKFNFPQIRHGSMQQSDGAPLYFLSNEVGLSFGLMDQDAGVFLCGFFFFLCILGHWLNLNQCFFIHPHSLGVERKLFFAERWLFCFGFWVCFVDIYHPIFSYHCQNREWSNPNGSEAEGENQS